MRSLFQQDCEYDSVQVRSGGREYGEKGLHGTFCGTVLPEPMTSEENSLLVIFTTDNTVQKTGFRASFFAGESKHYHKNDSSYLTP